MRKRYEKEPHFCKIANPGKSYRVGPVLLQFIQVLDQQVLKTLILDTFAGENGQNQRNFQLLAFFAFSHKDSR